MAADLILEGRKARWKGFSPELLQDARTSSAEAARSAQDFWRVAQQLELSVYESVSRRRLAKGASALFDGLSDLHRRVSAPPMWRSIYDQLQMTVGDYVTRATGTEKATALKLLDRLREMAGLDSAQSSEPSRRQPSQQTAEALASTTPR